MALQLPVGLGLFIIKDSRLYSDTPQSAGLLWTSDQPDAENSGYIQHSFETNIYAPGGIRTHNPSKREAAGPRP